MGPPSLQVSPEQHISLRKRPQMQELLRTPSIETKLQQNFIIKLLIAWDEEKKQPEKDIYTGTIVRMTVNLLSETVQMRRWYNIFKSTERHTAYSIYSEEYQ